MVDLSRLASDPWYWIVDQVIFALTNPDSPLLSDNIHQSRPDLAVFAAHLKEYDVTGLALLTELSGDCLRDELGVKSLGQRATLCHLIRQLQDTSFEFQRQTRRHPQLWSGSLNVLEEGPAVQEAVRPNPNRSRSSEYLQWEEDSTVHSRSTTVDTVTPGDSISNPKASAPDRRRSNRGETIILDEREKQKRHLEPNQAIVLWLANITPANSPDPGIVPQPSEHTSTDTCAHLTPETSFCGYVDNGRSGQSRR